MGRSGEIIVAQQGAEDGADLEQGEGVADAFMLAAAEGDRGEDILRGRPPGVEKLRVRKIFGQLMRHVRAQHDILANIHDVILISERLQHPARQHVQRRVQAQRFPHEALQQRNVAQRIHAELLLLGIDRVDLGMQFSTRVQAAVLELV